MDPGAEAMAKAGATRPESVVGPIRAIDYKGTEGH
jgi:hypothetical protein